MYERRVSQTLTRTGLRHEWSVRREGEDDCSPVALSVSVFGSMTQLAAP